MEPSASSSQPVVDYGSTPRGSRPSWLNPRVFVFAIVIGLLVGLPFYLYLDTRLTRGISARSDGYMDVNLKSMSTFTFDQSMGTIEDVPPVYRELDGKKVVLVGEMWAPGAASETLSQFDLVYSIAKCCFSGPPQIQHFVKATAASNPLPFYGGPVRVRGTLKVNVTKDPDGKITGVYHIAVESVEPV